MAKKALDIGYSADGSMEEPTPRYVTHGVDTNRPWYDAPESGVHDIEGRASDHFN